MTLVLTILFFLFSTKKLEAKSFSYQFVLSDNVIDLSFFKALELPATISPSAVVSAVPSSEPSQAPAQLNILAFDYRLKKIEPLPLDLPLFLVAYGDEVIFTADASLADDLVHHQELDLQLLAPDHLGELPVIYQNNYLTDFELELTNLSFISEPTAQVQTSSQIVEPSVIREWDQAVTVIFSLVQETKSQAIYELVCLDQQQKVATTTKLTRQDDFLWRAFSFLGFFANHHQELIFHLPEFSCDGLVYVQDHLGNKSTPVSIIEVKDL